MNTAPSALPGTAPYHKARYNLALKLEECGAFLTSGSKHPLVVERRGHNETERGFMLKLHEKNPNAPLSPFYLNLRTADNKDGPLTSEIVNLAATCMHMLTIRDGPAFDAVAGVPRAGEPFAEALARFTGKPCIALEKYEHGDKRKIAQIKGKIPAHVNQVLLVDDLITGADSKREAIEVLRGEELDVVDVVVLVDREQGGRNELEMMKCPLHSVFTINELLDFYSDAGKISDQLYVDIRAYLAHA